MPTFTSSSYFYSFELGVGLGMGLLSLALLLLALPIAALLGWVSAAFGARRYKAHLPAPPPAPLAEV